jgi:hypothetical protein
MRATFEAREPAEGGTSWDEEIDPGPVPGDAISRDGRLNLVEPFPQHRSFGASGGTFKVIELDDGGPTHV